jgi:predicted Zn-dependent protease
LPQDTKLTKIETLRFAFNYIYALTQVVESGYNLKSFDIEKLQSLTLSGEKINKEIFDALFINPSPYYQHQTTSFFNNNNNNNNISGYSSQSEYTDPSAAVILQQQYHSHHHHHHQQQSKVIDNINVRNYEIFKGAFDSAVASGKSTETSEYSLYDNRFYQAQSYY